jgi:NAD(P) transhydrogenase subunit beta
MWSSVSSLSYILAGILFVLSLRGLSTQESARRGNLLGTLGMLLAVVITSLGLFLSPAPGGAELAAPAATSSPVLTVLFVALLIGALIGQGLAARVPMTAMPELVAILHSFVGAAAVLVGVGSAMAEHGQKDVAHEIEIYVGVFIGAVTFTGSVVAFLKLRGSIGSKPLLWPGRHLTSILLVLVCIGLSVMGFRMGAGGGLPYLLAVTGIACVLGAQLVLAIGGGDMPVVVSLLNSYSGWTASAAGFMLGNDLLIITGALVGSSGAILSYIMCRAMNRSIWNVVFGGFGEGAGVPAATTAGGPPRKVNETRVEALAELLSQSKSVIIVPGYGMAVAQAQHPVKEISTLLSSRGVKVRYAIHPVAGRLPGHMNVLLAEANVSYEIVKEMEEINEDFEKTDIVLVIGANDIVNPSALEDPMSPIYGMPVLEVWKAGRVVMLKRGQSAGYAGVDNPLCYNENTFMLYGDAKQSILKLLASLQAQAA